MSVLADFEIAALCTIESMDKMIDPFINGSINQNPNGNKKLSYGLSSYGYDVRLSDRVSIFTNVNGSMVDPKRLDTRCLIDAEVVYDPDYDETYVILPPHGYMLGSTIEYFKIPRDVVVICLGKSTLARSGCIVNVTPIEPGFEGNVVIEISNPTGLPIRVYLNEGVAQFVFLTGKPCVVSYADRGGKYQGQTGVTLPKV